MCDPAARNFSLILEKNLAWWFQKKIFEKAMLWTLEKLRLEMHNLSLDSGESKANSLEVRLFNVVVIYMILCDGRL